MDFSGLAVYGRSPTRTAWVTNPVRQVAWWLVGPYFRGAGVEIDRKLGVVMRTAEVHSVAGVQQTADGTIVDVVRSAVASHLGGLRKDASAVAHRLAGLEEEVAGLEKEVAAAAHFRETVKALQDALDATREELRSAIQLSKERIDLLSTQAVETDTRVAGSQQEFRSAVQAANGRIDSLARGMALQAGDRISVGTGGLVMVASPTGTQLLVRQDDLIGRIVADGQEWEPHVRKEIERSARPDGIAVDAGAYIGSHTLTMSRWFKTVHAFEPQRGIFQILCGNLALNNRLNVLAHNIGLYDRAGAMRLAPQERQEVATPVVNGQPDYEHIKNAAALSFDFVAEGVGDVPAIALDDMTLENVALIKVDAQGADLHVLMGAEQTIRRCRPIVLFEWEQDLNKHHEKVFENYTAFFDGLGYDLEVLQDTTPGRQADYIARPRP